MKITITSDDGKVVVPVPSDDIDFTGHTLNKVVLEVRLWNALYKVADHEIKNPPPPVTAGRTVHREPEWFSDWPMEECSECRTPTRYWLTPHIPLCQVCAAPDPNKPHETGH